MDYSYTPYTSYVPSSPEPPKSRLLLYVTAGVVAVLSIVFVFMLFNRDEKKIPQAEETALTVSIARTDDSTADITSKTEIGLRVSEPARVQRVEYYVDTSFAAVTYALPFSFLFDPVKYGDGEYDIRAKVFDKKGKSYQTKRITVVIKLAADTPETPVETPAPTGTAQKKTATPTTPGTSTPTPTPTPTPQPPDTAAPSDPSNLLIAAEDGYTANLSWTASSDNVGVAEYRIYRDGVVLGASTGPSFQDQTVVPGNTYSYAVEALDAASNLSGMSGEPSVTLEPTSIWIDADGPNTFATDGTPIELGVKFKPLVNGKISGVRFYKPPADNGTHTGRLWAADGTPMGSVAFGAETATGWQTATFATPIDVIANTTYVVSYTSSAGHFSYTGGYFTSAGITSQYLTVPNNAAAGGNGVFATGGVFPNSPFNANNYWVDALFIPNPGAGGPAVTNQRDNSQVYAGYPGSNNTGVPNGKRLPVRDRDIVVHQNGAVIKNIQFNAQVEVRAEDVTLSKSLVNGLVIIDLDIPGSDDWTLEVVDSTVNGGANSRPAASSGHLTLRRANIYGGNASSICSSDCLIEASWLHGQYLPANLPSSIYTLQSGGGSNNVVTNSTIACDTPDNQVGGGCGANFALYGDFAANENWTITNNLFVANESIEWCASLGYENSKPYGPDTANIVVINNVFQRGVTGTCGFAAPANGYAIGGVPAPGNVWSNNRYDDGTAIPAPVN